jgi:F-type H+-transporting ATPase subunit b
LAAFGLDLGVLVAQIVNFFLLLALLSLLLYRPVTKMLHERSERIAKGLADAAEAENRAAQADADYRKRLEEARREAQAIVAQAKEAADKERQAILGSAQAEAEQLRARAAEEIERERQEALAALQGQVADLALQAASQVLGHAVDSAEQRRLVQDFISHLEHTP